ncbi:MAG: RsmF rRNA methyltransferase first C-terminal domain-containing protein, partial [Eubacteriales bacterium]
REVRKGKAGSPPVDDLTDYYDFQEDALNIKLEGNLVQVHSRLYMVPAGLPDLSGLKVLRTGWFLGELKKNRFKPVAPLALGLKKQDARRVLDFGSGSEEVVRYLKGETLNTAGERGWNMVCVDGFPLGWAKQLKDMLNNYYPSGWRRVD